MVGRLENKVAIITGGAGGIGAATGLLFCQEGGRVVLVDSDSGAMRVAVSHIQNTVPGARVVAVVADVGKEETASEVVAQTRKAFGAIDVLANIAGIRAYEPLAVARRDTWEKIIAVNLMSYAYFIRQAITDLRASGRGSIINISSTHAINPRAGMGQYDVTKAGIVSLTRTLAFEEAKHGIRVNAVSGAHPYAVSPSASQSGRTVSARSGSRSNRRMPAGSLGRSARGCLSDSLARL